MIRNRTQIIKIAQQLRENGFSHRQIAGKLNISLGSAFGFTEGIKISWEQHLELKRNTGIFTCSPKEKASWSSRGSNNWLSHIKYQRNDLLQKIAEFYENNSRIPTKREFNSYWQAYRRVFGSWNNAIIAAGLSPNPEMFAKKFIANDGHKCDSLAEKIIDDWFKARHIPHLRSQYYPGQKQFSVDFLVKDQYWIEFLGLKGELKSYDQLYVRKLELAKKNNIHIIEIYPRDLFPQNHLSEKLEFLLK